MHQHKIILASASPRRKQLLEWAKIELQVQASDAEEIVDATLAPAEVAMNIAAQKMEAVLNTLTTDLPVLAADTIVVCNGQIFGKPQNEVEAIRMLTALSGSTHQVITGVCLKHKDNTILFHDTTQVHFHALTASQIAYYVYSCKPYDKAGAYAIQEWIGVTGIKAVEGDFYNVMGLPVSRVVQALDKLHALNCTQNEVH